MRIKYVSDGDAFTEAMRNITEKKLTKLSRFSFASDDATVHLINHAPGTVRVDILMTTTDGFTYKATGRTTNYYASVDEAVDKLTGRLRRHKTELQNRHSAGDVSSDFAPAEETVEE